MFSYPTEPLLHKNQHDNTNNFTLQMSDKNTTTTTTAAVDVPTTYNVQLVKKGVVIEDRHKQQQEQEPENILSETAAVVVQRQRAQVDHSFTSQIDNNNNNNNWIQQEKGDATVPIFEYTVLKTNLNDEIPVSNAKTAVTQTDNTQTDCIEKSTSQKTGPVRITRSTQTMVTMADILYALQQQEQQQQVQQHHQVQDGLRQRLLERLQKQELQEKLRQQQQQQLREQELQERLRQQKLEKQLQEQQLQEQLQAQELQEQLRAQGLQEQLREQQQEQLQKHLREKQLQEYFREQQLQEYLRWERQQQQLREQQLQEQLQKRLREQQVQEHLLEQQQQQLRHILQEQELQEQVRKEQQQEREKKILKRLREEQQQELQKQKLQEQLREQQQQQQQELREQPEKAILKQKLICVEIPNTERIFHTGPLDRKRQPIVIPASEDEYPLVPIDSSDSEWDNGEDIPYNPPIIRQEEPITTTNSAERIETGIHNNRVKRPIHSSGDVQRSKNKRFKKSSGSSSSVQKLDPHPSVEVINLVSGFCLLVDPTKLVRFFCPYEGCDTSMIIRSKLFDHIRNLHDPSFHMHIYPCILKTRPGRNIDLENGNSRNLVRRGEKIRVVRADVASTERFYCPYKKCFSHRSFGRLTSLYRHLQKTHHLNVPREEHKNLSFTLETFSGRVLKFDENSRNTLDDKERILVDSSNKYKSVPKIKKEKSPTKDDNYYCPYKNCAFERSGGRNYIYKHIRKVHDRQFLPSSCGRKFILTNSQGKVISDLDEHSRNSINIDEHIKVFRGVPKK